LSKGFFNWQRNEWHFTEGQVVSQLISEGHHCLWQFTLLAPNIIKHLWTVFTSYHVTCQRDKGFNLYFVCFASHSNSLFLLVLSFRALILQAEITEVYDN
jgi:hypothetical protein